MTAWWVAVALSLFACVCGWLWWDGRRRARRWERHTEQALSLLDHPSGRRLGPPDEWLP